MLKLIKGLSTIETIGELAQALDGLNVDMPLCDSAGEPILLRFYEDTNTGDLSASIG